MKTVKSYISGLAAAMLLTAGFSACQDDIDAPFVEVPVAANQANTTIAELKAAFWQDASNYADSVRTKPDGSHYIIKGRVISSDEQSNVFKNISIQDETGAITFSVNSYNLYLNYRRGQEIVVDATGMYIGKYAGLQQFGTPSYYENGSTWQVGFMSPQFFRRHLELNGVPEVEKLDTITVNSFSEFDTSAEGLRKWQSQLVRINNVHFQDGGVKTFSEYHSNSNTDVNKTLIDSEGNSNVVVRTSGYATFWNKMLPEGNGDIVGILSFYQSLSGSSMWQLILNDYEGCMNFGNPTVAPGTETNPYQVADVIRLETDGTVASGWVSGYIVGSVAPGVTEVTKNEDIVWGAEALMPYTLVIGADKETKDFRNALVIELPANTPLRQYGNLRDNPGNYQKAITVRGDMAKVMGTFGVANNSGAASQFKIEGVQTGVEGIADGDGSENSPYSPSQVVAMNPSSTTTATRTGVWVKGYIVGYMPTGGSSTLLSGTVFGVTGDVANTNLVIAPTPDETNPSKCVGIQLPTGTLRTALNLKDHPENIGKTLSVKGDVMKYCGGPGVKNGTEYKLDGQGGTTPDPTPSGDAIFSESFEGGSLGQFTTTVETAGSWTGWRANTNTPACAIANSYVSGNNEAATAWMISPAIDLSKASKASIKVEQAFGFYFPTRQESFCTLNIREKGGQWQQLTLTEFPTKGTGNWTSFAENSVDISAYVGKTVEIGFKYVNDGKQSIAWEIKNFSVNADAGSVIPGGGDDPKPDPDPTPTPSGDYKGDFNSFNNSTATASPYSTYTNATGWTAEWSVVLGGTDGADASPLFSFIGKTGTLAPTLNGNTSKVGKLISPTLTGGCGTLTFNYGFAFNETKCSFTVKVLQGGSVVKEDTVTLDSINKQQAYSYSLDVNVKGDFSIEIVNNCYSAASSNKDRVSIWNLTWTD